MAESWSKLTVAKLKEELKARGLVTSGLKAQLVSRLEEDDEASLAEANESGDIADAAAAIEAIPEPSSTAQDPPVPVTIEAVSEPSSTVQDPPAASTTLSAPEPTEVAPQPDFLLAQEEREEKDELPASDVKAIADAKDNAVAQHAETEEEASEGTKHKSEAPLAETSGVVDVPEVSVASLESVDILMAENGDDENTVVDQAPDPRNATDQPSEDPSAQAGEQEVGSIKESENRTTDSIELSQMIGTPISERVSQQPELIRAEETFKMDTHTSVGPEEVAEDSKKRKRRSQSPQLQTQDATLKKLKALDGSPKAILPEDRKENDSQMDRVMEDAPAASEPLPSPAKPHTADARFKGLFSAQGGTQQPRPAASETLEDRDVAPAVHPATGALYIRNLQRPLQLPAFREHLASLAQPSNTSPSADPIVEFFVDTIKSHCLVRFVSISSASRVRLALHGVVWPNERDRRELWIDYIPEDKVNNWIETEKSAAASRPPKKWEVTFEEGEEGITAQLKETDGLQRRSTAQGGRNEAPTTTITKPVVPKGDPGRGFKALDDLFMSTTAKPKLYFQPVPEALSERRLDLLAQGRGGGRDDEMRRFSFEDDMVVDKGPEWGLRNRIGDRRGRGGFRGVSDRGPHRGGDSWRSGR